MGTDTDIEEKEISLNLLYISLHNLLLRKVGIDKIMTQKELFCHLGKHFLIPKNIKPIIFKEMQNLNMVKKIDRYKIEVLECKWDLETDTAEFYKWAGIY